MEREQRGIRLLPGTRCRNHSRAYERGLLVSKLPLCGRSSREFRMEREWRGVRFPPDERAGAAAVLTNEDFWYPSLRFADVPRASSGWSANGAGFGFRRTSAPELLPCLRTRDSGIPASASRTFLARVQDGARMAWGSASAGRARWNRRRAYERGFPASASRAFLA